MENNLISMFESKSIVSSPVCLYDGNFKGKATRMLKIKYKRSFFRCFPFDNILSINLNGHFDVCFAVNKPDVVCGINMRYRIDLNYPVYVGGIDQPNLTFSLKKVERQIDSLLLTDQESLFVLRNGIFLNVVSCDNIHERFDLLLKIKHVIGCKKEVLEIHLPPEFRNLEPFARKWAESDDLKRQEMSESMTDREKKNFMQAMGSYAARINDYLNSYQMTDAPVPEAYTVLERLAELYAEMQ